MSPVRIIVDAGPLVAFLNKSDPYHQWAVSQFSRFSPPFFTCESVLSEVCFLSRRVNNGPRNVFKLLERDLIKVAFSLEYETKVVSGLMNKYRNVPMSLADA